MVLLFPILLFACIRRNRSEAAPRIKPQDPPALYGLPTYEDQVHHAQNPDGGEPTVQLDNGEAAAVPLVRAQAIDDSGPLVDVDLPHFKDQV